MPTFFPGERKGISFSSDELQKLGIFSEHVETLFANRVLNEADEIQQIVAADIIVELIGHGYLQRAGLLLRLCILHWQTFDLAPVYIDLPREQALINIVRNAVSRNDIMSLPPTPSKFRSFSATRDVVLGHIH